MDYTSRIDGFQIRDLVYLPGFEPKEPQRQFDIVKWQQTEPREVIDGKTGEKRISTEYCYSVARLNWDEKIEGFNFQSIGLRWLEIEPTAAVCQMIKAFAEFKTMEYRATNTHEE